VGNSPAWNPDPATAKPMQAAAKTWDPDPKTATALPPISKNNPRPGAGAANLADPDNPISSGDEGSQPVDAMMSPQSQREATTRGAAIGVGGLATAAAIPAAAALAAPRAIGQAAVGTGILDASGQEITRLVTQYGPSAVKQVLMHPFVQSALKGLAIGGGSLLSGTAGYKILKSLGVIGHD